MLNVIEQKVFFPIVRTVALICGIVLLALVVFGLIFAAAYNPVKAKTKEITYKMLENALNPERRENSDMVFNSETGELKTLVYPSNVAALFPEYKEGSEDNRDRFFNKGTLLDWLEELKTFEEKQDFLNNLSKVINSIRNGYPKIHDEYLNGLSEENKERLKGNTDLIEARSGVIAKIFPKKIQDVINKLPDETRGIGNIAAYNGVSNYLEAYASLKISGDSDSDSLGIKKAFGPYLESAGKAVNGVVKGAILFGVISLFSIFILITLVLLLISIEKNTRKETT
ncbi:hypothetical protein AGMMS49546_05860 [Spirochaetia bacterium]|nr:hypothetical protein AGMMS49546_05860 [Spirochaetia bacterium]